MAKKFAGFTPEQLGKIDDTLAGKQSDEQMAIIRANPALAARVGKMSLLAQRKISGTQGMQEGGLALDSMLTAQRRGYLTTEQALLQRPLAPSQMPNLISKSFLAGTKLPNLRPEIVNQPISTGFQPAIPPHSHDGSGGISPSIGKIEMDPQAKKRQEFETGLQRLRQRHEREIQEYSSQYQFPFDQLLQSREHIARGFQEGGDAGGGRLEKAKQKVADAQRQLSDAQQALAGDPTNETLQKAVKTKEAALAAAQAALQAEQAAISTTEVATGAELQAKIAQDPMSMVKKADVATVSDTDKAAGTIAKDTGQVTGTVTAGVTTAKAAPEVTAPEKTEAVTYEPVTVEEGVQGVMDRLTAATGKPSDEALADAATMSPDELAQLGLSPAQIAEAQKVKAPEARKVEEGELIEGATVDMKRVRKETNFEAATGAPSTDATVQGQLTGLMEDFEGKEPPAWAAGAMRAAASAMAARGLSASSMAGQAIVQAAMESALPIAVQDAEISARFEMQNLSNKQQAAMFAAEKRAEFLGLEFTQEFQARVQNAAKISDIANMNFTAEQQIALENARMAQTVDIANLDARNAKIMADAAAMTQLDMANLNNRQQAAVQNAQAFLDMDMQNLTNEQQTATFRAQQLANALLSDQAAQNAARQFNSQSENQTNQFFASLANQVAQFNVEQSNAMSRFNAGEANALSQFNANLKNQREQFNATNHLVVAQANAQWFQSITTAENAAQNQANRDAAMAANNLTMTAYNNTIQRERDILAWAWQSAENAQDRDRDITVAKIRDSDDEGSNGLFEGALGKFLGVLATNAANSLWGV